MFAVMNLRELIRSKGLKIEWVIGQTSIPRNRFFRDINNLRNFSPDELDEIAKAINVKTNQLYK